MRLHEVNERDILKFDVARGSYEKKPYYVEVIKKHHNGFTTSIPGKHILKIFRGNNLAYHLARAERIGKKKEFKHLLYNQTFIIAT